MSYDIQVGTIACRIETNVGTPLYILYQLAGCNNLVDEAGKFCRTWNIIAGGTKKSIESKIQRLAEIADGGGIQPIRGRRFSEASYKKACKTKINQAAELKQIVRWAPRYSYFLSQIHAFLNIEWLESNKSSFIELTNKYLTPTECSENMDYHKSYFDAKDAEPKTVKVTLDLLNAKHTDFLAEVLQLHPTDEQFALSLVNQTEDDDHVYFNVLSKFDRKYADQTE